MIYIVTGLPGAGKTTYVKSIMTTHDSIYDLDYMVEAFTLCNGFRSSNAIFIANSLLKPFVKAANECSIGNVYIIRVALSNEEIEFFNQLNVRYLNIDTDKDTCYSRRCNTITLKEFDNIAERYDKYLRINANRIQTVLINKEHW